MRRQGPAEFSCVVVHGSADEPGRELVRVSIRQNGITVAKFELPCGEFFQASTGRLTTVSLI